MSEVDEVMKGGEQLDIAELAREHSVDMLGALVSMAKREGRGRNRAPHSVASSSAKTVLELAHGKAATQESEIQDTGLTIIVNNLMTGQSPVEKVIDVGVTDPVEIDSETEIEITGEAINLAEDLVDFVAVLDKPPVRG
jgi:hypothetical protein